ncbi:MAG: hypothetical protein LHW46_05425 [Candidatus Cloacimonetes bacterium]|nr:hypothetical protein [Candidatus Cloacimonadota bacterium]MCK9334380.1 hypothetical protein [Candidatus Cloacimonadota bacterium]
MSADWLLCMRSIGKIWLSASGLELVLRWVFTLLSVWAGIAFHRSGDVVSLASAALSALLFQIPPVIGKLLRLQVPVSFRYIWFVFILAAMYLGEIHSFFYRYLWWDDMLHTCTAMLVAYLAMLVILISTRDKTGGIAVRPMFLFISVLAFTMAFGAVWELFEFSSDQLLGVNMLKGRDSTLPDSVYDYGRALINTMQDLSLDLLGALVVALLASLNLKRGRLFTSAFGLPLRQFQHSNPRFFRTR